MFLKGEAAGFICSVTFRVNHGIALSLSWLVELNQHFRGFKDLRALTVQNYDQWNSLDFFFLMLELLFLLLIYIFLKSSQLCLKLCVLCTKIPSMLKGISVHNNQCVKQAPAESKCYHKSRWLIHWTRILKWERTWPLTSVSHNLVLWGYIKFNI